MKKHNEKGDENDEDERGKEVDGAEFVHIINVKINWIALYPLLVAKQYALEYVI